jgi:hypothetical protein
MRRSSQPPVPFSSFRFVACVLFLFPTPAGACNIPVFRYALEHWPADAYQIVLFHRGPLSPADQAAVAKLEKDATEANCTLSRVDLAQRPEPAMQDLFEAQHAPELPWLVARYPAASHMTAAVAWTGRLSTDTAHALVDSPVRQEIARQLLTGDCIVWVVLQSGDRTKDAAVDRLLHAELRHLKETLRLPQPQPDDQPAQAEPPPLRLSFPVVRVSRQDPAEKVLVRMLLSTEPDLMERTEPMVFPIFGRGRVLYALVGAGIDANNLGRTTAFLTGACSCEVKRENPGTDLLLTADWGSLGDTSPDPKPPARPTVGESVPIPGTTHPPAGPPPEAEQPADAVPPFRWARNVLVGVVALTALLVLVTGALTLRSRKPTVPPA